jgi:predicted MPP superfamily phosphohydrolase
MIFLVILLSSRYSVAQTQVIKLADDHYEIIFSDVKKDSIRIIQVTDVHLGNQGKWAEDFKAVRRIKSFVKSNQPDLIFVTGDLFTGEKKDQEYGIVFAAQFFDDLERPWIYVFGNHDPEGGVTRKNIWQIFKDSIWGIIGFHSTPSDSEKYDFQVDLKLTAKQNPVWEIYAFDSGSEIGNKSIKADQIEWFQQKSLKSREAYNQIMPAISIFHIPLKQYEMLWDDPTLSKSGFRHEIVCYEEDDGTVYEAFLRQGNIKACFCGHDHDNNYWGKYHGGILLVYGHVSGEACYHRHWEPGAKLITLPVNMGEIGIRELMLSDDR